MADLSGAGNLAARLMAIRNTPPSARSLQELSENVAKRFGDHVQAEKFERMVRSTCQEIEPDGATGKGEEAGGGAPAGGFR